MTFEAHFSYRKLLDGQRYSMTLYCSSDNNAIAWHAALQPIHETFLATLILHFLRVARVAVF